MAEAQDYWDWRKNLPPVPTMSLLGVPSMTPVTEGGIPTPTATLTRPYTAAPPAPALGPGYTPNLVGNPVGVKFPSGMPLGDFGNPAPTAASGQPNADDEFKKKALEELLKNKDFGGALAMLVKGMGGAKSTATSSPFRVSGASMGGPKNNVAGAAGAAMQRAMATLEDTDLRTPLKRKGGGAQSRYDILKQRQSQDLSELFKNLV